MEEVPESGKELSDSARASGMCKRYGERCKIASRLIMERGVRLRHV